MGQLIANGVLQGLVTNTTSWGYRIPWAIQWVWPPILIFGCIFAPESPWWLVRNNRLAEAEKTLARLTDADSDKLKAMVSQMLHTIEIEREIESGSSYWHCFKGVDLRRTEICCFAWATQMLSGAQFAYGPSYFFLQAGMDTEDAYKLAVGSPALGFLATALSWILLSYAGRRTIFLGGISTLAALLAIIGIIAAAASANNESALWAQASLCLVWQFVYSLTLGPMAYVIVSETSAVRLRAQSVVLARNFYNVTTVWAAVLEPYMIHPEEWNLKGKTAFVWCATSVIMTIWGFFRLPECGVSTNIVLPSLISPVSNVCPVFTANTSLTLGPGIRRNRPSVCEQGSCSEVQVGNCRSLRWRGRTGKTRVALVSLGKCRQLAECSD